MSAVDDDDEVVGELDVLLAKDLVENLHVLQYPITKSKQGFSADQRLVARVKPQHNKLELEVVMDTSSPNYDQSKGEQIALNVDGGASGEGMMTYENSVMDTQVLTSRCVPQIGKRFAVGLVQNGQVHVTPISQVMQLQPSFKYMDRAEMRALQAAKMKAQAESGNSSQDEADDAKTVTVRYKGTETEASRAARERSYAAYEKRLTQEKWISAVVHHEQDSYSARERNRLLCRKVTTSDCSETFDNSLMLTEMSLNTKDYLKTLIPQYVVCDVDSNTTPDNVLSIANLKLLSLGEQLKLLMRSAKIMHFSHLLTLLPSNPDANSVVRSLQSFAVLVQGCWVVKSEILYPPNTVSSIAGTPADLICKVRDYILCLFTKNEFLVRKEIAKQVNVSSDEVEIILDQIARMKVGLGWRLKLEPDPRFKAKFPEVYERQSMVWTARYKQLAKQLNIETEETNLSKSPKQKQSSSKVFKSPKSKKSVLKEQKSPPPTKKSKKKAPASENCVSPLEPIPMKTEQNPVDSVDVISLSNTNNQQNEFLLNNGQASKSFTELMQEPIITDLPPSANLSSPLPFLIPQALGKATAHEISTTDMPGIDSATNMDFGYSITDESGQFPISINIDNIKSTVALVNDQIRQQNNGALTFQNDVDLIESEESIHKDVCNVPDPMN